MPEGKKKEKVTVKVNVTPKSGKRAPRPKSKKAKQQQRVPLPKVRSGRSQTKQIRRANNNAAIAKMGHREDAKQLAKVMEAITLPREATPIKLGTSKYGGDPTGACNPFEQVPTAFNTVPTGNPDFDRTNVMFAFRSLLRSNVYSYYPSSPASYAGTDTLAITPGEATVFNPGALQATLAFKPHGNYLYAGRHGLSDTRRGFWADLGAEISVSVPPLTLPPAGLYVNFLVSNGREWKQVVQFNLVNAGTTPGTCVWTPVTASGYYALEIGYIDNTKAQAYAGDFSVTVAISWSATSSNLCYGHLAIPDIENQFGSLDAVRITAVSLMNTNNSAAIQKQGTLCGVQFDKGTLWSDSVTFTHFTSNRKAKILPSDNGMYGFLKPLSEEDFEYSSEYTRAAIGETTESLSMFKQLSDAAFLIIPDTSYLGIAFEVNRPSGVFPQGVTAYWTRAFGLEFLTNDQWRSLARSTLSPEILELALHLISETVQWHENEFHIDDLWNTIKSFASQVVNGIVEYGPTVLKGATMLAPLLL